jgi:hypothetical protein
MIHMIMIVFLPSLNKKSKVQFQQIFTHIHINIIVFLPNFK